MSFLNKMGAAVGIGACEVDVVVPSGRYHWYDAIRGTVQVRGGTADQTATEVRVGIMEHWVVRDTKEADQHYYKHHNEVTLARNVPVPTGSAQQWEFEVKVPEGDFSHDWYVQARVCVPMAVDREGNAGFVLLPPASALGLGRAVCQVAPFTEKAHAMYGKDVHLDYRPPANLEQSLDGVKLMVREQGDQLVGTFEVNPQEHSIADRLKALVHKDRVRYPISFPAAPLAAAEGGAPVPDEVVAKLRELLQPYLG
jgi:sporulation-control protein spo0M